MPSKTAKTKLLLLDRHQVVMESLTKVFEGCEKMKVVGTIAKADELLAKIGEVKPDIVICDVAFGGTDFFEILGNVKKSTSTKVIVLSSLSHRHIIDKTIKSQVEGVVLKESSLGHLFEAIDKVKAGEDYICPATKRVMVDSYYSDLKEPNESASLNEREYEVIRMLCDGRSSKEIALELGISSKTVDACRRELMYKLHIHSVAGLVKYAIKNGLTAV